ncbi:hypothetical protein ABPG77_009725 [Micractinium sp. CCAP 211/92]
MALETVALAGAGPALPTRALGRSRPIAATQAGRQSGQECRPLRQAANSRLGLAPAPPPPPPPCLSEAEHGMQRRLNNLVPFHHAKKNSGRSSDGDRMEQQQASVASPSLAAEAAQQQPSAAQPSAAASHASNHGAMVRARRRSRLLARAVPGGATQAGPVATAGEQAPTASSAAAADPPVRRQQRASPRLNAAQEQELATTVAAGGPEAAAAVVTLVDANRLLVQHLARRFLGRGVDRQDLVGEGLAALERAAKLFRPHGEARFSTYAAAVVWRAMQRAVHNHSRVVRLPSHQYFDMRRVRRATEELQQELGGRQPSTASIAERCGFTPRYTVHLIRAMQRSAANPAAVQQGAALGGAASSDLDLACEDADQERQEQFEALRAEVHSCMHALTPKQQQVVTLRWGLLDGQPRTLKEVGDALGFTGSWASAQYKAAERKLRAIMAGDQPEQEHSVAGDRLTSGAGAAVVAVHEQWAEAARDAVYAALPSLSPEAQLVLALRHGWLDGRKVMPSCETIASQLNRSKSWVVAKVRHAEQQLLRELHHLQQQGTTPQLSPPPDPRHFARLAPFSRRQVRQWQQLLERVAAANAAEARRRAGGTGGSSSSVDAAADSKAAGSEAECAEDASRACASARRANGTAAAPSRSADSGKLAALQTGAPDAGMRPTCRNSTAADRASSSAAARSTAGKAPKPVKAQGDASHFEELADIAATDRTSRKPASVFA